MYYLSKGFTEQQSTKMLAERQATFSLKKLTSKFGRKEAMEIWVERQKKWQKTLDSTTDDEKKEINSKKAVSLKNLQRKYGEELGQQKYYKMMANRSAPGSKEADNFFKLMLENIEIDEQPYWSQGFTKNEYFLYNYEINKFYFYDFTLKNKKLIIEYHGGVPS